MGSNQFNAENLQTLQQDQWWFGYLQTKGENDEQVEFHVGNLRAVTFGMIGCSQPTPEPAVSYDASKFMLPSEPDNALNVIAARESAKDQEQVVVLGRIGGELNPWVEDRAAFYIVDPSLLACSDEKADGEPCSCPTPWDYCCEPDKLPNAMTLVKFVETDGTVVKHDARKIFDVKELQTVIVKGTAQRDDAGNLTILADGMFVRK